MKYSVIIPTYNQADLLEKALLSISYQRFNDFEVEVIVVNNYSTDHTLQVLENSKLPNLQIINFNNNGIIAASRNVGAKSAKGTFLCFLDSDDEWYPEKLASIDLVVNDTGCKIISHDEHWVYSDGRKIHKVYGPSESFMAKNMIFRKNCLSTSAVSISRNLFHLHGGFSEKKEILLAEDYEFWIRLSLSGELCKFIPKILGMYRVHNGGNSRRLKEHRIAELNVLYMHKLSLELGRFWGSILFFKRFSRIYIGSLLRQLNLR